MALLKTLALTKSYGRRTVVRDVSLDVRPGEVVGLLGPNGAGKTTTFYMVVGLTAPDSGRVALDGQDITTDPMYVRAKKGIRLSSAGAVRVSRADGGAERPGDPRDAGALACRAAPPGRRAAGRSST